MLAIWHEIVQTDSVVQTGVTMLLSLQLVALVLAMLLTENMSNSCKNFLVVHLLEMERHLDVSKPAQETMTKFLLMGVMSNRGNVDQLAQLPHGNSEAAAMIEETITIHVTLLLPEAPQAPRLGLEIVDVATTIVVAILTTGVSKTEAMAHLLLVALLRGNKHLLLLQVNKAMVAMVDILLQATVVVILNKVWALLLDLGVLLVLLLVLRLDLAVPDLAPFFNSLLVAPHHLHLQEVLPHHLHQAVRHRHHLQVINRLRYLQELSPDREY